MKSYTWIILIAITAAITGCAKDKTEDESWDTFSVPAANSEPGKPGTAPAPSGTKPGVILGSQFTVPNTNPISNKTEFRLAHYFEASAPLELKTSASLMKTQLRGETTSGAMPLIGFRILNDGGKYFDFPLAARPIDGEQSLTDKVELPAGKYTVKMNYYKDTGNGIRPTIVLKQITFE